jgi:hypothetical protein
MRSREKLVQGKLHVAANHAESAGYNRQGEMRKHLRKLPHPHLRRTTSTLTHMTQARGWRRFEPRANERTAENRHRKRTGAQQGSYNA